MSLFARDSDRGGRSEAGAAAGRRAARSGFLLLAAVPLAMLSAAWLARRPIAMSARLEQIAEDLDPVRYRSARLERKAAAEAESARWSWRHGKALLDEGRNEESVEALARALRLAQDQSAEASLLRELRGSLATAWLRLGEQQNCIERHNADACLLPIRSAAVHALPRGSRRAIEELEHLLESDPDDLASRWLLNIAHMTLGRYPRGVPERWLIPENVFASEESFPRFRDVAEQAGVAAFNLAGGSVADDFDGDGLIDIVTSGMDPRDQLRFFRNEGDGTFADRTEAAGLLGEWGGLNLIHADYDNDGDRDLLVLRGGWMSLLVGAGRSGHPNSLLRNEGDGTFTNVTQSAGLLSFHPTQTAAWGDYDNDGWLDLVVGNESTAEDPHPPELFHNQGDGSFVEVAARVGLGPMGFVKAVAWGDYDNDDSLELYVSRHGASNLLFHNEWRPEGGVGFVDRTREAGVAEPHWSFPAWFWDYDNDGWLDLFVAGYTDPVDPPIEDAANDYLGRPLVGSDHPRLYHNRGDGSFEERSAEAGLDRTVFVMGANYGDLDNDGFLDLYLGTGAPSYRALLPNRMFRSLAGMRFADVTTAGGFGHAQKGHGVSFADFDNDGDQDLYHQLGGFYPGDAFQNALFENPGGANAWLGLELVGVDSNRDGLGARLRVVVRTAEGRRAIRALVSSGGSFGGSPFRVELGLGRAEAVEVLEVHWPATGKTQRVNDLAPNRRYRIREGESRATAIGLERFRLGGEAATRGPEGGVMLG